MKEKLRNILNLTNIFIKENEIGLIDLENKEINKKSILFWIYLILFSGISYLSFELIGYLRGIGKPQIFLNAFLLFLEILIIFRTIMLSTNIFYFSKDIENILHLPFKSTEILIAKFNTILSMVYEIEIIFGFVPLLIYGIITHIGILYFINLIFILIIFPIFIVLIISTIMIFLIKSIKLFKNKDLMQIIISFILIFIIMLFMGKALNYVFSNMENIKDNQIVFLNNLNNKIIEINKYFLNINPSREILECKNVIELFFPLIKLIFINFIAFLLFIFLGNKLYLKQLLKANFYLKNKKNKNYKINKRIKKSSVISSYINKEFKLLKNPIFLMQSIYPVILITIMVCILICIIIPKYKNIMLMEQYKDMFKDLKFDIEAVCLILGGIQIVGLFNYSSITSFSREGKNAYIIKLLPISLYKQFIYKNIPQIFINTICTIPILTIIKIQIPEIENKYILIIFILSFILNLINSFILTLIDLLMPNLDWDSEYEILKNNKNKIIQYVLIIFNILFFIYIKKIFEKYNLNISLIIFGIILFIIFIIINLCIWKYKNRLFKKIN